MWAAWEGKTELVELLLADPRVDVNITNSVRHQPHFIYNLPKIMQIYYCVMHRTTTQL